MSGKKVDALSVPGSHWVCCLDGRAEDENAINLTRLVRLEYSGKRNHTWRSQRAA